MYLGGSFYDEIQHCIDALESDDNSLSGRVAELESWNNSPVAYAGDDLPTNLPTNLVFALVGNVAGAMNNTNGRINSLASRVNAIQSCLIQKGLMAGVS